MQIWDCLFYLVFGHRDRAAGLMTHFCCVLSHAGQGPRSFYSVFQLDSLLWIFLRRHIILFATRRQKLVIVVALDENLVLGGFTQALLLWRCRCCPCSTFLLNRIRTSARPACHLGVKLSKVVVCASEHHGWIVCFNIHDSVHHGGRCRPLALNITGRDPLDWTTWTLLTNRIMWQSRRLPRLA